MYRSGGVSAAAAPCLDSGHTGLRTICFYTTFYISKKNLKRSRKSTACTAARPVSLAKVSPR